ncbi:AraC family transcriptional regulator [Dactylosporangium salmoneum]|uniref:AraC family transcriptional regulator n=1 Tax=Dactylosporangium salmoneum TaxID=53361 RepID=UPI0031E2EE50
MPRKLAPVDRYGLERSGTSPSESIRFGLGSPGLDRAEVSLSRTVFQPHRHDSYALGITTGGVQTFGYRGARRVCLPGQLHLLHPDELHDGAPGVAGFTYRIVYLAPALVRDALAGGSLPFVAEPVQQPGGAARPIAAALARLLADIDEPIGQLLGVEAAVAIADGLAQLSERAVSRTVTVDVRTVRLVREYLTAHVSEPISAATLERLAGADRYTIVRQFKAAYGTTPDRYRLLRRLDAARAAIGRGQSLARAAVDVGFADQSHLTRQFKRAYGMTPGCWQRLTSVRGRPGL